MKTPIPDGATVLTTTLKKHSKKAKRDWRRHKAKLSKKHKHKHKGTSASLKGVRLKAGAVRMGPEVDTSKVKFLASTRGSSIYEPIRQRIEKTKPNKSFSIEIPAGITAQIYHSRIAMALGRNKPKLKKGLRWEKRTSDDGQKLVVSVYSK